jgi:uncharacterized protein YbaP (TraB family)
MDFLLTLYLNGKIHKLSRETEKTSKSNKKVMITQRNKEFTNKIEYIIQETNNTFISFGAGHLGGKDGVIKSLKKKDIPSANSIKIFQTQIENKSISRL